MIRVLVFIAILVALSFGAAWLVERPGEVVMTIEGYRVETSVLAAVGLVAALALAIMVVLALVRFLIRLPSSIGFAARARRRARGFSAVSRGMIAVGAGDPRAARRNADDAGKLIGDEPLVLLLKAQAAQMAGDRPAAEGAFKRMLDDPDTRVLGLRGLFVEARRKGDVAAARAYAAEASRLAPTVAWSGEALLEYQCADADWPAALATLERGAKAIDKAAYRRQRAVLLTADALSRAEREPDLALQKAQEAVKLAPALVPAVTLLARLHSRRGDLRKASRAIETAWSKEAHPDLAEAYVAVRPGDSARDRLTRAEKLLSLTPREPEARIAVAQAAFAARDLDSARKALAPLLEGRPPVRVCLLMADIEEENDASGSVREWLSRASRAPRDPAWIADGVISDRWSPISPVTGRLDAFVWGTPVEQLSAPPAERPVPAPRLAIPPADVVLVDADEPQVEHPEPPAPASAASVEAAPTPVIVVEAEPAQEPGKANGADPETSPGQPKPLQAALTPASPEPVRETVVETPPDARPAAARRAAHPTPVVFPLASPPDDPGPELGETPQRGRSYLQ
jgi:HemY protein